MIPAEERHLAVTDDCVIDFDFDPPSNAEMAFCKFHRCGTMNDCHAMDCPHCEGRAGDD